ncbi:disease resistance protein RUN1 isoform X2 [Eucalyptus grandis]|uniref:disease resistance protein RUN1 isoform X2 n=1 Tax=Eucalyptus grandis TaxID=71139 RepID=UPI00192F102E|nr:disease resistance protein RUN1 isoform X2 [Eucalyptus grandis]
MVEFTSRSGGMEVILPVFYDVDRSEVKLETRSNYTDLLDGYYVSFSSEKVERWKKALVEAGQANRWDRSSYGGEHELVKLIVGEVFAMLKKKHSYVPEDLYIGAEPHMYVKKHKYLRAGASSLKADIEHKVPKDLYTGAKPFKTDKEHEDVFTGAGPLKSKIEHNYVPEDPYTGADPFDAEGKRINVHTSHLQMAHAKARFQGPMLSCVTSVTWRWSLLRSVITCLHFLVRLKRLRKRATWRWSLLRSVITCLRFLVRLKRLRKRATSKWSLIRPVVTFLCYLFRLQRIRNWAYPKRMFHRRVLSSETCNTSELEEGQVLQIIRLLDTEVNDVRIVGILGRDGIGKTALAKIIYNKISLHFDACSFLAEIEETTQQPGGVQCLQTKLIFDILKREHEAAFAFKGVRFLKKVFRNMKVLLVLDGVESGSLLEVFVGPRLDWFGLGSRIIVTSKQGSVLQGYVDRGLAYTYYVSPMDDNRAFDLFWQYAMGKSNKLHPYVEIADKIVKAAEGLPLLVKVFGSFLHGKGKNVWIEFKDHVQEFQEDYQKILSVTYEALDQKQKQMYLDIACFLPDVDCRIASYMWHDYDRPHDEIEVLRRMSLITMEKNKIGMHSILRCLARKIISVGFHDPGTWRRFYIPAIAQESRKRKMGTDHLDTEVGGFHIPPSTKFLSLGRTNIGVKFADALLNVRWLHWQGCPRDFEAIGIDLENLVILDLPWSKVTESWGGWKGIKMERLKVLNLTGCADLIVTPSFSCCPNLEILILEQCSRLVHLDPSINDLKLLVTLNLKFCSELSVLPVEMDGMNALRELLIDGTFVRELPASIGKLVQLQILSAANCFSLVRVPGSVCELKALSVLALDDAKILELPESIGDLGELRCLLLRDCHGLGELRNPLENWKNL